jgi:hypothetical protein
MTTRTYWLSFCDDARPRGSQFLGALVVDVTDADAKTAHKHLRRQRLRPSGDAAWIGAAVRAAWKAGVNPGGNVACTRLDETAPPSALALYPRLTLLSKADCAAIDAKILAGESVN